MMQIDKSLMRSANMTRRVANEVEIHWQLRHASILELFNYFEDSHYVYLVMELCKNGELFKFITKRSRPLSEPEARGILIQLVSGLKYLHSNNIIHRDLKLSNLLLSETFDLKIADFGLAARLNDAFGEQKTMCGTPNYISPEIVSRRPYGLETDLWSLGCMMVTILTGSPPFQSQEVKKTLSKASKLEYHLPDNLSPESKNLIHRLLQLDPKNRLPLSGVLSHPFFDVSQPVCRLKPSDRILPDMKPKMPFADATATYASSTNQVKPSFQPQKLNNPFSTARLKPLKQKTKHGLIEIMSDGHVFLDFVGEPHFMVISGDGQTVSLYSRNSFTYGHSQPVDSFIYTELSSSLMKKHRYAIRFVELVRAKTPKVIFYSPQAKCMLMENTPVPDFEMTFYTGMKVQISVGRDEIDIKIPATLRRDFPCMTANMKTTPDCDVHKINLKQMERGVVIPVELQPVIKHAQECLKQCMDVEHSESNNTSAKYPVILKSSHVKAAPTWNQSETASNRGTSPALSIHPSSRSTFTNGTNANYDRFNDGGSRGGSNTAFSKTTGNRTDDATLTQPCNGRSGLSDTVGKRHESEKIGAKESGITGTNRSWKSSGSLGGGLSEVTSTDGDPRYFFIDYVGWCFRTGGHAYVLLFNDGCKMTICADEGVLIYAQTPADVAKR